MSIVGPAIGAVSSLIGGALNQSAQAQAAGTSERIASENRWLQEQMAHHGVSFRADDVMRAYGKTGIHPLALLGMQGSTVSPVNYVGSAATGLGDAIQSGGQGVARAVMSAQSDEVRMGHMNRMAALAETRAGLENEVLKFRIASEAARLRQELNPPMPTGASRVVDGQGNAPLNTLPLITGTNPAVRGTTPDISHIRTGPNSFFPAPHKDTKELIEDDFWQQSMHGLRNVLLPFFGFNMNPPGPAPYGQKWYFDPIKGYRLTDTMGSRVRDADVRGKRFLNRLGVK